MVITAPTRNRMVGESRHVGSNPTLSARIDQKSAACGPRFSFSSSRAFFLLALWPSGEASGRRVPHTNVPCDQARENHRGDAAGKDILAGQYAIGMSTAQRSSSRPAVVRSFEHMAQAYTRIDAGMACLGQSASVLMSSRRGAMRGIVRTKRAP